MRINTQSPKLLRKLFRSLPFLLKLRLNLVGTLTAICTPRLKNTSGTFTAISSLILKPQNTRNGFGTLIMHLVMFDIDGTLTRSNDLDDSAFASALGEVFNIREISTNWAAYPQVTDAGIFQEICVTHLSRIASPSEEAAFRDCFLQKLHSRADQIKEVPGANAMLAKLRDTKGYAIAYAGGAWTESALLKLQSAHLPYQDIPYAFSNDAMDRESIAQIAQLRAEKTYGCKFDTITYIGDGVWDVWTAQKLGFEFIGITCCSNESALLAQGAVSLLADYTDPLAFMDYLRS
jgi:phosphoglycolate phosphatase-like HAD superfamily hydrolase